jgi:murein DD-endopeptidase MepM/ murein hydrolase activator NlpD
VQKGDTLQSIAKKYKADVTEIAQYNHLAETAILAVGEIVLVPDGEIAAPPSAGRPATLRGASGPNLDGYYLRPLLGGRKTQGLHGYNGVDIASYTGAPVLASAAGSVIIARSSGWNGGYGNYVAISHPNGTQTLYAHLSGVAVNAGANVVRGEIIGYVGSTGRSTGPHLHFEVRGARNPF